MLIILQHIKKITKKCKLREKSDEDDVIIRHGYYEIGMVWLFCMCYFVFLTEISSLVLATAILDFEFIPY